MAYSTINVTINGVTKAAIDLNGAGTSVILEESLSDLDKTIMDQVSLSAGATFAAKLAATTIAATGKLASVTYARLVIVPATYSTRVLKNKAARIPASYISTQTTQIADHESRIDVLETP